MEEETSSTPNPQSSYHLENLPTQHEVQIPSVVDSLLSLPFAIGDLVWAYISGYPLWPSLITPDPVESIYTKTRSMLVLNNLIFCFMLSKEYFIPYSDWKSRNPTISC